jgi:hypothetical protein
MPDLTEDQLDQLIQDLGLKNPRGGAPRKPIAHGELRGAKQHRRRGEKPCDRRKPAEAAYQRNRHRARYHPEWLDTDDEPRAYLTEEEWQEIVAARRAAAGGGQR